VLLEVAEAAEVLLHLVGLGVADVRFLVARMPGIATAGFEGSPRETFASEPTTSCNTRAVCSIEAGAPSAARIVGARSISSGGCSNGVTFGPPRR
jgi:hypothetical protein